MEELNRLARQQEELGLQLMTMLKNMKKDSPTRKTASYVNIRQTTANTLWEEAQVNHTNISAMEINEHTYFQTNYMAQIEKAYQEITEYLADIIRNLQKEEPSNVDPNNLPKNTDEEETKSIKTPTIEDREQSRRIKKQSIRLQQLHYSLSQAKEELRQNKTKIRYETLLKRINKQWESIQDLNEEILVFEPEFKADYFTNDEYRNAEEIVEEITEEIEIQLHHMQEVHAETRPNVIALPKIKIPFFDGGYENWNNFFDIFYKVIHLNSTLSNTEKMQYLKTHIRNEPSKLIQHLQISEANYTTAWDLLQKRYQNKRLLLSKMIDKILDLPYAKDENIEKIKQLHDVTTECLEAINNIGVPTKSWGPLVSRIIVRKWDPETNKLYEQSLKNPSEVQEFPTLMAFLETRFQSLEAISNDKRKTNSSAPITNKTSWQTKCTHCKDNHYITACQKFKELTVAARFQVAKNNRLCINCLKHDEKEKCPSSGSCYKCHKRHHTLLHKDQRPPPTEKRTVTHISSNEEPRQEEKVAGSCPEIVLLATALIKTESLTGDPIYLRALIDPGSQASFITEIAAQMVSKPREKIRAEITGVGSGEPKVAKHKMHLQIFPRFPSHFTLDLDLLILSKLTRSLPNKPCQLQEPQQWQNRILADPTYNNPGPIDVILGAEVYGNIINEGLVKTTDGILGQNTELGWILSGTIRKGNDTNIKIASMITCKEEEDLSRFWELEEVNPPHSLSIDDKKCEEIFNNTVKRKKNGSYIVRIPFKEDSSKLGQSKARAAARLLQLEKRLTKNPELGHQYKQFMAEYLALGHMRKVRPQDMPAEYYIPHQAVIREASTTTKLRVVFDASSKTSLGNSFNDTMYVGPRLQQELCDILLRWRKHKVAFTADIEKMYRQIQVHKDDQPFQRILWRFDSSEAIEEYQLTTVTYGTSSAPYLAVRTLQQLAKDEERRFPQAAEVARRDFYVDDVLSGAESTQEALKLQRQLINMMESGGFRLRKWSSNKEALLQSLPHGLKEDADTEISEDDLKKSLGVYWAPHSDTFRFKVNITRTEKITKRNILAEVAKLFDPLGWLSPVVIQAKLLIQELWLQDLTWDQQIPEDSKEKWVNFHERLQRIEEIVLPRWINYTSKHTMELHGFCDASEKAYGAVIYVTSRDETGLIKTTLLISKSKVAPARTKTTLPKLELCAAVLLSRLIKRATTALDFHNLPVHGWTDSMITLAWIKGNPSRWKTFVANRVGEINSLVPTLTWLHVKTEDNPADVISRGISPEKLKTHTLWWNGPTWLNNKDEWPKQVQSTDTKEETKRCHQTTIELNQCSYPKQFSTLGKMVRVLSYCKRFIQKTRRLPSECGFLTVEEIDLTMSQMARSAQMEEFKKEIRQLQQDKRLDNNSRIVNLNPFIDAHGILRVGGRLEKSHLSYNEKHPIILPYQSHLSKLIVLDTHHKTLHGGNSTTLAFIRRKFWIINGKNIVRKTIKQCVKCIRYNAQISTQLMGELPAPRVTPSPPFTHCGVDYAGPIQVRTTKGRGHKSYKGYIAIFVCLSTKAIHLEAVTDMTTDGFLAAFRRFTARRGPCGHMYSDNGTNFVGASKILEKEVTSLLQSSDIQERVTATGTQWHFILPAAPHFGGLWEAGVKSMKHHFKRIVGTATLTYEEITTLLHQIEACLNSRPLCPLSNDMDDPLALTPGHFLIGRAIVAPPNPVNTNIDGNLVTRWKLLLKMKKDFWSSWSSEYLSRLQQRYKWKHTEEGVNIGDLVIIKEQQIDPSKWPLGRITNIHSGTDGIVRAATIQRSGGNSMKRAIHGLIRLPPAQPDDNPDNVEPATVSSNMARIEEKPRPQRVTTRKDSNILKGIMMLLALIHMILAAQAGYTVQYPKPGLYVEHIGHSKIERGIFRIEVKFDKLKINDDVSAIADVIKKFDKFCNDVTSISSDTQCKSLLHHLHDQENQMLWIKNGMDGIILNRQRRGLLGKLLTSVFGVNDEVYQDIEDLDKNQHQLIQASNHQTKFMLSALSTFNDTETRINNQLDRFRVKLNKGLDAINDMKYWFNNVDANKLNIHVLSTYQVATNFITELCNKYTKLMDVHLNRGNIYDLITPAHVEQIVTSANQKLPSNLKILTSPILRMNVIHDKQYIKIYSSLPMVEMTSFVVIKIDPIPLKIENEFYWVMDVPSEMIAVDYNNQAYFLLTNEEFNNCIKLEQHNYICTPATVKDLQTIPNCVIDEIYRRTENTTCPVVHDKFFSTIWKKLYMPNTWMFITDKRIRIAITCNGIREDIHVNQTGIIQISQECIIKTAQNILTPKREEQLPVIASYNKPVSPGFQLTLNHPYQELTPEEPVLKASDALATLTMKEHGLSQELQNMHWYTIKHHSVMASGITTLSIAATILLIWTGYVLWKKWKPTKPKTTGGTDQVVQLEEIPLQPLYKDIHYQNGQPE